MKKPNIIWLMADQLRADMISCNGDENVRTPNIDALAEGGINFNRSVSTYPLCCPARGAMLTGLYPNKGSLGHEYRLDPSIRTLANIYSEQGYHTAYVGKWHLDGWCEKLNRSAFHIVPRERRGGFDYWMGYENNNSQYDCYVHGGDAESEIPPTKLEGYETDCLTDIFLDHLRSIPEDKPFFAVLSVQPPHNPYVAPERNQNYPPESIKLRPNVPPEIPPYTEYINYTRENLSNAYAMIENYDENIGRIVSCLKERGLYDNTYIMFFSDHGDTHGSHGIERKTNPLEESIRVPFIIGGKRCSDNVGVKLPHLLSSVDIAPTSLGLCGIEVPEDFEGFDYSPFCRDPECHMPCPTSAYIQNIIPEHHARSVELPWRGVVTADGWKYVTFENIPWMLFNLNDDPYEFRNLAHSGLEKKKRGELGRLLDEWIERTGDRFSTPKMDKKGNLIENSRDIFGYPMSEEEQKACLDSEYCPPKE